MPTNNSNSNGRGNKTTVGQVVIPYTKGIAESIKQICGKYGIQVHFKGNTIIKQILMMPKDQDPKDNKSGLIYSYQCNHLDCDEEYIGETARTLRERQKGTPQTTFPLPQAHSTDRPHHHRRQFQYHRKGGPGAGQDHQGINFIRVNNPTLNQIIGKYNLNHIWDRVLFNTPGLKLGSSQQGSG